MRDWDRMVTFYQFPQEHWRHLRTTNVVESPFAGLRLRTNAAKRYKKVENATAVIWKMLLLAEQRFHRLNAPEKLKEGHHAVPVPEQRFSGTPIAFLPAPADKVVSLDLSRLTSLCVDNVLQVPLGLTLELLW